MGKLSEQLDVLAGAAACHRADTELCRLLPLEETPSTLYFLPPFAETVLGLLYVQLAASDVPMMSEVLRGAHVAVQDPTHQVYELVRGMNGAYRRPSSHRSDAPQLAVN